MERGGGIEDGQTSIPLLLSENPSESSVSSSPATAVVVLSTLVAVFGSYVFGSAVSFPFLVFPISTLCHVSSILPTIHENQIYGFSAHIVQVLEGN